MEVSFDRSIHDMLLIAIDYYSIYRTSPSDCLSCADIEILKYSTATFNGVLCFPFDYSKEFCQFVESKLYISKTKKLKQVNDYLKTSASILDLNNVELKHYQKEILYYDVNLYALARMLGLHFYGIDFSYKKNDRACFEIDTSKVPNKIKEKFNERLLEGYLIKFKEVKNDN